MSDVLLDTLKAYANTETFITPAAVVAAWLWQLRESRPSIAPHQSYYEYFDLLLDSGKKAPVVLKDLIRREAFFVDVDLTGLYGITFLNLNERTTRSLAKNVDAFEYVVTHAIVPSLHRLPPADSNLISEVSDALAEVLIFRYRTDVETRWIARNILPKYARFGNDDVVKVLVKAYEEKPFETALENLKRTIEIFVNEFNASTARAKLYLRDKYLDDDKIAASIFGEDVFDTETMAKVFAEANRNKLTDDETVEKAFLAQFAPKPKEPADDVPSIDEKAVETNLKKLRTREDPASAAADAIRRVSIAEASVRASVRASAGASAGARKSVFPGGFVSRSSDTSKFSNTVADVLSGKIASGRKSTKPKESESKRFKQTFNFLQPGEKRNNPFASEPAVDASAEAGGVTGTRPPIRDREQRVLRDLDLYDLLNNL